MKHLARVFAVDPTAKGFGYCVFEGPTELVEWGHAYVTPSTHKRCMERLAELLAWYEPDVVVAEDCTAQSSRRGKRADKVINNLARFVEESKATMAYYSPEDVKESFSPDVAITKHDIATIITTAFPELDRHLPPRRKVWMSENPQFAIFDAAAFGLTYYCYVEEIQLD